MRISDVLVRDSSGLALREFGFPRRWTPNTWSPSCSLVGHVMLGWPLSGRLDANNVSSSYVACFSRGPRSDHSPCWETVTAAAVIDDDRPGIGFCFCSFHDRSSSKVAWIHLSIHPSFLPRVQLPWHLHDWRSIPIPKYGWKWGQPEQHGNTISMVYKYKGQREIALVLAPNFFAKIP